MKKTVEIDITLKEIFYSFTCLEILDYIDDNYLDYEGLDVLAYLIGMIREDIQAYIDSDEYLMLMRHEKCRKELCMLIELISQLGVE